MAPTVTALLCFGLCLGQGIRALAEPLPRPTLHADPGPLVPWETPVTLRCRGHPEATWYRLMKGKTTIEDYHRAGAEAQFIISSMSKDTAGHLHCLYWIGSALSEPSEPLDLVVTGYYSPPQLSAEPSQHVAWGHNVTLRCRSPWAYNRFVLYREGGANSSQWGVRQSQSDFLIPAVAAHHEGNYSCFVFHSQHPHTWSLPSAPLELRVTVPVTSGPRLELPDVLFGLPRLQTGIWLGISALLILFFLLFLLFLLLRYHRKHQARQWTGGKEAGVEESLRRYSQDEDVPPESPYATMENIQIEEHGQVNTQVEDPQEVTYAHLIHHTPNQDLEYISPFPSEESTLYAPLAIQEVS
ncbi:platelet glycoprotein VI-like isoform X1 [Monodelphis domestica]|uniref:platelet glycoprotein VI-like isoform X1 n=1 Tax=Monodelphis domestica TaxID=13616 RepID=UPI0024E25763|nr:platelet glycoprotein VI-like isoform X1 [Monodelphis domestica]